MSDSDDNSNFWVLGSQVSCEWEVPINDILNLKHNRYIDSPNFWLSGKEIFLCVYAVRNNNGKKLYELDVDRVSIKNPLGFSCSVSMQIDNDVVKSIAKELYFNKNDQFQKIMQIPSLWRYNDFMSKDAVVNFICRFHSFNNFSTKETQTTNIKNEFEILSKSFGNVFLEEDLSDVTINVGSKQLKAHKIILAARSPVFSSMFKHNMSENLSGTINIEDCDSDTFESFLKFLYTGKTDLVTSSNAFELYKIAHKYELKDLQFDCSDRMSKSITTDNICDVLDLCVIHEENQLLETATYFFIHNFKKVLKTKKWLIFLREKPIVANELLQKLADARH